MSLPAISAVRRAQVRIREARLRSRLVAVASGKVDATQVTLEEPGVGVARVIEQVTHGLEAESIPVQRIVAVLTNSGAIDRTIARLDARTIQERAEAARTVGALRIHEAVPSVAPLLASNERRVADAAARALGRIGGSHSATALLSAIQRRGSSRRLVAELARSAPDLFVENALREPGKPGLRSALAIAAGLRHRKTAVMPLIALLEHGSRRERVNSCRALGWIGARSAIPVITAALLERDWKLRVSAAKALGALQAHESTPHLRYTLTDRNPRVCQAARQALRRIEGRGRHHGA
jgi:HEAT repeat protein